jgi:hypothetical protein
MYDTRLIHQVVELERRIQIENEKKGEVQPDKYAMLPHVTKTGRKEDKSILPRLLNSLKAVTSLSSSMS